MSRGMKTVRMSRPGSSSGRTCITRPVCARQQASETRRKELAELRETRLCARCKRPFQNRKKWQSRGLWPGIRYCSERCRRSG